MKAILIAIIVVAAIGGIFLMASQKRTTTTSSETLSFSTSPTPLVTTPTEAADLSPTTGEETATEGAEIATKATIKTSKGDIVLTLYPEDAPKTVANFVKKAKSGYYRQLKFHRVEDWVLQGGDPLGNGTGGGNIATELNDKPFVMGSLGVARGGDIKVSNDSQFFITKTPADWLDGQYTNFGIVTEGMDVVKDMKIGDRIQEIIVE
jgi:peptidyl-prolyl cis-trans isomerase B (cyclophilin B)